MSETTKIQWADSTFNPWTGCTKVSPGCANCYAATSLPVRFQGIKWGKGQPRKRTAASTWRQPIRWNAAAAAANHSPRIFPSLCDWLDPEVPAEWLSDFLALAIRSCPDLNWLLLTKRPEQWRSRMEAVAILQDIGTQIAQGWLRGTLPLNVWVGTSVEDRERAEERIPELRAIPAVLRFLSVEPLLGPVDLQLQRGCRGCNHPGNIVVSMNDHGHCAVCNGTRHEPSGIGWVIVGGESGPKARPCYVEWIIDVVEQCIKARVPCFVKQLGSNVIDQGNPVVLKHRKGGDQKEWPALLRIQEMPS